MYRFLVDCLDPFLLLFLIVGVAIFNLWRKRTETRRRLLLVTIPYSLLFVVCTPAVSFFALGSLEWQYPPRVGRPPDAEAIVVLSGSLRPVDEEWSRVELGEGTLYRCLLASRLYRQGKRCPVVLCGGKVDADRLGPTLAKAMRDFLVESGVDERDLVLEERSTTTYENAVESAKLLKQRGIGRVILVTDATHLRRAESCFRAQAVEVIPRGTSYRANFLSWSPLDFLPSTSAARDMKRVLHEWLGILWYGLNGRI